MIAPTDGILRVLACGSASPLIGHLLHLSGITFIVADTPEDERDILNMADAASRCDAALILLDACLGVLPQTRRQALICCLMGVPHLLCAVNKMEHPEWSEGAFREIESQCAGLSADIEGLGISGVEFSVVPVSALYGDNIATLSERTPWYHGATVFDRLLGLASDAHPLRFPAQGNRHVGKSDRPEVAGLFKVRLVWMAEAPLYVGRRYIYRSVRGTAGAEVTRIRDRIDLDSCRYLAADRLEINDIGEAELALSRPLPFDPYHDGFILIDRVSNATVARGMLLHPLRQEANVHWQREEVSRAERAAVKGQRPRVIWLTGLSGAGKSTIANSLERKLHHRGIHTMLLDGDNVRHGLNRDLGFTEADRVENIRRIGEVAKLMTDAGLVVITAFISPYRADRDLARSILPAGEFLEVFVDTPLSICEERDPKGLYQKARQGLIPNFTGISAPYEAPEAWELRLDTARQSVEECAEAIISLLNIGGDRKNVLD